MSTEAENKYQKIINIVLILLAVYLIISYYWNLAYKEGFNKAEDIYLKQMEELQNEKKNYSSPAPYYLK